MGRVAGSVRVSVASLNVSLSSETGLMGFRVIGKSCAKQNMLINTVKLRDKRMGKLFVCNAFKCIFAKVWLGI
jgi:hypothetical protein